MKKIMVLISTFFISGLVIYSCKKADSELANNDAKQIIAENSNLNNEYSQNSLTVATRVLKSYTVTNAETGETKTFYDCREKGRSCDVGETPPPVPPTNGFTQVLNSKIRENAIVNSHSKPSSEIFSYFQSNESELRNIFPKIYDSQIQSGIKNGSLRLESNDLYIAIVENTKEATPIFVYKAVERQRSLKLSPYDTTKTRVAKINTEKNTMECIDPGTNCAVSVTKSFEKFGGDHLLWIETEFNKLNLTKSILNNEYKIFEAKNHLELRSNSNKENFYIIK
jgi:hypothetical protein